MQDKHLRIFSFGEILFDVIEGTPYLGGAPLNLAAHLQKLGAESHIVSAVGRDKLGETVLAKLTELNLDSSMIAVLDKYPTGTVTVTLDERKIPAYSFGRDTAYDHIPMPELSGNADLFCFGTLAQRAAESRATLKKLRGQLKCPFFYDVNLRQDFYSREILEDSMNSADLIKLNDEEIVTLAKMFGLKPEPPEFSRRFNIGTVILTLGPKGCEVYSGGKTITSPAVEVKIVSTVGAGDAFSAAFLYHYLNGDSLRGAADAGNALAAVIAGQEGAI